MIKTTTTAKKSSLKHSYDICFDVGLNRKLCKDFCYIVSKINEERQQQRMDHVIRPLHRQCNLKLVFLVLNFLVDNNHRKPKPKNGFG